MSFPSKADREKCWGAKDRYWECLDSHEKNADACNQIRAVYESACPAQWVKHFDRKRSYLLFKDKIENEGLNPAPMQETAVFQNHNRYIPPYTKHHEYLPPVQEEQLCDTNLAQECCTMLLKFLEKSEKQYRLRCDIVCALFAILSSQNHKIQRVCQVILDISSFPREMFFQSEEISHLLKKYSTTLLAGALKYLSLDRSFSFEEEFPTLLIDIKKHIFDNLSTGGDQYALLHTAEFLLELVHKKNANTELLDEVFTSVMCIVTNFWNHHISEVRARAHRLSVTCLKLNYYDVVRKTGERNNLKVIVNLKLFKAFASDMFWSVPYKYFAYEAGLEFYATFLPVSKFLLNVKTDMQEGFIRSLRNKRVIGSEIDLFKFCTRNLSLEEWTQVFQPVVDYVILSNNIVVANNFSRYWLPVVLRKYPEYAESLWNRLPTYDGERRNAPYSRILFALLKVCHKYDIQLPVNETDEHFLCYLESCFADEEDTRGELFSLLCNLHEQSVVPTEQELRLILRFLQSNAHSSSTILRQQTFSSFASFVLRIHCSGVKALKMDKHNQLEPLITFMRSFSTFLLDGMQPGCSYQRKIMSLTSYKIFMSYAIGSCGDDLRRNNLKNAEKFVEWMKERECWCFTNEIYFIAVFRSLVDPCGEIQNTAFLLLRSYFDLTSVEKRLPLLEEGLSLMRSNLFYTRNSGVTAILSLICLAYNTGPEAVREFLGRSGTRYSTFTEMFLCTLRKQIDIMQQDMLHSAVYEPLDATIKVLTFLVADINSPELKNVTESQIKSLIEMLEDIVPLLLKALCVDDFADYAPSFEESDHALQQIIEKSKITDQLDLVDSKEDEFQLKPLYQILLNFIWVSLKACCECESKLVICNKNLNKTLVIRCSDLIVRKLRLCRHKGVIEAAGISLSNMVQVLTACNTCERWLDSTLMNVIDLIETKSSASISRKSAGLSLLIQNIVGNDKRTNKPLLKKSCEEFCRVLNVDYEKLKVNVSSELPQTHALHFLRVLIADARNSADLLPYFEDITLLCLRALEAPFWIIRNASLQLFGAVLPKIVGQKNTQNDFGVRRSFEEIFSCMPRLLVHIVRALEKSGEEQSTGLISHSNLVPLLVLLCNAQVASVDTMERSCRAKLFELRKYLTSLLGSGVYNVRKLAGKALISLHCQEEVRIFKHINDEIVKELIKPNKNENLLHGMLLMLKQAFSMHADVTRFRKQVLRNLTTVVTDSVKNPKISLMSETLLSELNINRASHSNWKRIIDGMKTFLSVLKTEWHLSMGYDEWSRTLLRSVLENCDDHVIVEVLNVCLHDSSEQIIVENVLRTLDIHAVSEDVLGNVVNSLCRCMENHLNCQINSVNRTTILNLIFELLLKVPKSKFVHDHFLQENYCRMNRLNVHEYHANNLRILGLYLTSSHPAWIYQVLVQLHGILQTTRYNRDIRLHAAEGIQLLCNIRYRNAEISNIMWKALIDMLCDEEIDIRSIGCRCVKIFEPSAKFCCPDEAIAVIFDIDYMEMFLAPEMILDMLLEHIWIEKDDEYCVLKYSNDEIANPFDQGVGNSYREDVHIMNTCARMISNLIIANKRKYFSEPARLSKYFPNLRNLVNKCDTAVESEFFINAEMYIIVIRYYYLLVIAVLLLRNGFVSEIGGYKVSDSDVIIQKYNNLAHKFSLWRILHNIAM